MDFELDSYVGRPETSMGRLDLSTDVAVADLAGGLSGLSLCPGTAEPTGTPHGGGRMCTLLQKPVVADALTGLVDTPSLDEAAGQSGVFPPLAINGGETGGAVFTHGHAKKMKHSVPATPTMPLVEVGGHLGPHSSLEPGLLVK